MESLLDATTNSTDTAAMQSEVVNQSHSPNPSVLRRSFPLHGPLVLLAGGEGRTYRAGNYVYRWEAHPVEAIEEHEFQKESGILPDTRPFATPVARMVAWLDRDTTA